MKIVASSVIRAHDISGDSSHGGLYVVDMNSGEIENHIGWSKEFLKGGETNPRGGERGLRGIVVRDNDLICASAYGLLKLDKETLEIKQYTVKPEDFEGLHEICLYNGYLWLSVCAFDCIAKVDPETFEVVDRWHLRTLNNERTKLELIQTDQCNKHQHLLHINSIAAFNGRLVFSGTGIPGLYSFEDPSTPVVPFEIRGKHNFYEYEDYTLLNDTKHEALLKFKPNGKPDRKVPIPARQDIQSQGSISRNNFLRGMARNGNKVYIGSTPARIMELDLDSHQVTNEIRLSDNVRYCIHGLEILEG